MSQHHINELIQMFLSKNDKILLYKERIIVEQWQEMMGSFIANQTKSVYMKQGILYVHLKNAALRFELMGMRSEVIKELNKRVKMDVVKDIIIR